jgi:hypothetical protein
MGQQLRSGINDERKAISISEFLLMFILLALSGNPFFIQKLPVFITLSSVVSIYYLLRNYNKTLYYRTFFIFLFFMGYEVLHALMFQLDYTATIVKLFMILLFSFTVVNMLRTRFVEVFIQTLFVISIISFFFTALCYVPTVGRALYNAAEAIFPLQKDFKGYSTPTLIIYTFFPEFFSGKFSYTRNPAIFWEGGAFAVFLNLALYLKYYTRNIRSYSDLFDRQSVVFMVAILTTVSTMGFLSMVTILSFYTIQLKSNLKYLFMMLVFLSASIAFFSLDFLGEKVEKQLSVSGIENNRFGSALMDLEDFSDRPLLGWSRRIEVLFQTKVYDARSHRPNGLTNFLRSYGLVYFAVYFYLVYTSFRSVGKFYNTNKTSLAVLGILLLWIVSFSELIFDLAFLKSLVFLHMVYKKNPVKARKVSNRPIALSS